MSRKSRMKDLREKKDRRMKIIAIGGAVLLAVLLAWEIPHFLGGSKSSASATTTTAASTTPDGTAAPATATPATGTPVTAAGTAAAGVLPTASSTKLSNSDVAPARTQSQLYSFSHFSGKNPFVPQVATSTPTGSTGSTGATGTTGSSAPAASAAPAPSGVTGSGLKPVRITGHATSATIEVNGKIETEHVGSTFPSSSPVFKLVSISGAGAKIGIANGNFSNGAQAVSVAVGKSLTLVNKTNGRRYVLLLLSVS